MTDVSADGQFNAPVSGAGKTVLVVEDNDPNMMMFHDLLVARGYRVLQAPDGLAPGAGAPARLDSHGHPTPRRLSVWLEKI